MSSTKAQYVSLLSILTVIVILGTSQLMLGRNPNDQPLDFGPKVVMLKELENEYEPVPFDHLGHAKMAQMWHGCETCHHYSPQPGDDDLATTNTAFLPITQESSKEIPACKSCHPIAAEEADIHMPSLKGAYHRQCLNCHKEWMHENACVICHEPKENGHQEEGVAGTPHPISPGDIIGRMHPPIPEPDDVLYETRFTPADGGNVLFRHRGHTIDFKLRCVECHYEDNCSHCHGATGDTTAQKPLQPGMTWAQSHGPCITCHNEDRCQHCHFEDEESPPLAFTHLSTGQALDDDHAGLACSECHENLAFKLTPTCGDASCHDPGTVSFPEQLPGPLVDSDTYLPIQNTGTATASTSPGEEPQS